MRSGNGWRVENDNSNCYGNGNGNSNCNGNGNGNSNCNDNSQANGESNGFNGFDKLNYEYSLSRRFNPSDS